MPELPEVETVVRDLRPLITGQRINGVRVSKKALRKPWRLSWSKQLVGQCITAVRRRGKWIVLDLSEGGHLVIHLGMTGQLCVFDTAEPRSDHTHLVFQLVDGCELRFRDIRRFGSATFFVSSPSLDAFFLSAKLGPEPFDLAPEFWRSALAKTDRCLKAVLLDQRVVAGVGNIYADESLFEAKLHPECAASSLSVKEADRLRRTIAIVLRRAIGERGTSFDGAYVGGENETRVYGRTGSPCRRCTMPITRIRLAGRSTHFCPQCQSRKDEG